jgi:exopolysaccharide biosynthesis polyprenyl glycosylphosphotransferase
MQLRKDRYYIPLFILLAVDIFVLFTSMLIAYNIRFETFVSEWIVPKDPSPAYFMYVKLSIASTLLTLMVFKLMGFYQNRIGMLRRTRPLMLMMGTLVSYIFLMCILFYYRAFSYSRLTVVISVVWGCGAMTMAHYALRLVQSWMIHYGICFQKILLVVDEANCANVVERLRSNHGSQYQIIGCVATNGFTGKRMEQLPVLGKVNRLGRVLKRNRVDNVLVASSHESVRMMDIVRTCESFSIGCHFIPDVYERLAMSIEVGESDPLPILPMGETPLAGGGMLAKQSIDMILATMFLTIMAIPMLLIAIIVKLDSRGPVFFRQPRIGSGGRLFTMLKFRSMHEDAERGVGPVWARKHDPRCTRAGSLIRKLNLDELPQLFNVIRGDMSLVGPRPERAFFINQFKSDIPQYMRRQMVKPGITGWAQINGWRGDTSVEQRVRYDMYYIENWSLSLDFLILLRTPVALTNAH